MEFYQNRSSKVFPAQFKCSSNNIRNRKSRTPAGVQKVAW